jgi:hypothetical protein
MNHVYQKLGELLLAYEAITEAQLEAALELQANSGKKLGEILVDHGFVAENRIAQCLAQQYGCEVVDPILLTPEPEALGVMDAIEAMGKRILPIKFDEGGLFCVLADPLNLPVTDDLGKRVKKPVRFAVATESDLMAAIRTHYGLTNPEDSAEFSVCLPKRYKDPEYRGRMGSIVWGDVFDTVLKRKVTLFRAPESGSEGDEHWDLVIDSAVRHVPYFVPVFDSVVSKGFRWTTFEQIQGESLGSIIRKSGSQAPAFTADVIAEVARAAYESSTSLQRRSWISPENIWVDGNRVSIVTTIPVAEAYLGTFDDLEALGYLLLHCLTGRFNSRGLDSFGLSAHVPIGMVRILERCLRRAGTEEFESAKEFAVALQSFRWAPTVVTEPARTLDREELLATFTVVTPKKTSLWERFLGRRAA